MSDALHFCSTPRNVLLSIGQAWQDRGRQHHLLMIDQPKDKAIPIIDALVALPGPFASIKILRKGSGLLDKRKVRKTVFADIDAPLQSLNIDRVFTGNDRRIEFQYAMHRLCSRPLAAGRPPIESIYLEDGVNSYLPFHPSHRGLRALADPVVEPLLKKLGYGSWYDRSGAVGCSRWVNERRLTFPALLQIAGGPPVTPLKAEDYTQDPTGEHLSTLVEHMTGTRTEVRGHLLMVLPHSNDLLAQYGSFDAFQRAVAPLLAEPESVWVKYHPNETAPALEGLVSELPRRLPMEILMSQCHFDRIVGDTSAALLGAKWLLPAATVMSVRNNRPGSALLFDLMSRAGVEVIDSFARATGAR